MSVSISVQGFASKDSPEFKKHYAAVKFCVEHELSLPVETSKFFEGKFCGDDLEDYQKHTWLYHINDGVQVDVPMSGQSYDSVGLTIKVADIPAEVDQIIIKMC